MSALKLAAEGQEQVGMTRKSRAERKLDIADAPHHARLEALKCIAGALAKVVRADTEVIVHDLRRPEASIARIVNGHISNRREGQPILSSLSGDLAFDAVIHDAAVGEPNETRLIDSYETRTREGKTLASSSVIFFDEAGQPAAALCMNVDPQPFDQIQSALDSLVRRPKLPKATSSEPTVDTLVTDIITSALQVFNAPVSRLSKREKIAAVATMHERGLFSLRGSAEMAAEALGTTKFTIYNYLDEIKQSRTVGTDDTPDSLG
ncbi:helix-turn-helix transcriptional regulator [Rhizorhabdus dicambivorans]|uniref:Transcriptional regulator n=1 Tax=Rhizorhabdus dicambivorans TaxID=1850238 RepID=A0A2A4FVD4_9SPHN|nr:PAS domain-containing protein [Rhizorhabdus dicambivorans]PCE42736.1 hypothetical protein COO09_07805 [Rhizorhabdus dicambivorans]